MRRLRVLTMMLAGLCAATGAAAAAGDTGSRAAERLAGRYVFDTDRKGASGCTLTLGGEGQFGEYPFTVGEACRAAFPFLEAMRAWSPRGDGLVFIYRAGGVAMRFTWSGLTDYSGALRQRGGVSAYFMMARFPERPEELGPIAEFIKGPWRLWARPEDGAPACDIALLRDAAGRLGVDVPSDCDGVWPAARQIASWRIDHPWTVTLADAAGAKLGEFAWMTYRVYGMADEGPALTRIYGR